MCLWRRLLQAPPRKPPRRSPSGVRWTGFPMTSCGRMTGSGCPPCWTGNGLRRFHVRGGPDDGIFPENRGLNRQETPGCGLLPLSRMGNAELFYSVLPHGGNRFRRRGKQYCPALQKRFPEIHLKVGGKEGAFAPEDHSEQQLTLKGRLPKKWTFPLVPGYIIFISFPPGILKRIIGIAPDASIAEISPWRPEKGKFSLPETGSGLRFMRRAGIQPNPRLRKKTGGMVA